ncbi:MAG: ROK family transcriptional regulator, partial [Chloroflexota bacterium]
VYDDGATTSSDGTGKPRGMKKATREQIKQHNQQLVLKSLYHHAADNRAALAQETGLTKPTISSIVTELMEAGLVIEGDRGTSSTNGGKRPRLLHFVPTARQIIAVTVTREQVLGCLAYLDGTVVARHHIAVPDGNAVLPPLHGVIDALHAQTDAPLLCLSVGVPGVVDNAAGVVVSSPSLGWKNAPLAEQLSGRYELPTFIGNNTEFATRAQALTRDETRSLVTLLISDTVEIGSTIDGATYQHGADITVLHTPGGPVAMLEWANVKARATVLAAAQANSVLPNPPPTYLHIRRALLQHDPAAHLLLDEISETLAAVYAWVYGLMRPTEIALAGQMSLLGPQLLDAVRDKLYTLVPGGTVQGVRLMLAPDDDLTLQGAVANALHKELAIL